VRRSISSTTQRPSPARQHSRKTTPPPSTRTGHASPSPTVKERFVTRRAILDAVDSYELVESYPEDKYLPSYLLLARPAGGAIHVLFAADLVGDNVRVGTAYRPSPDEWMDEFKTRRVSQ
jgi:hypothetical protein